jgi:TetR/AcrR family transcriptional repressor of mexAB-oprM operon
MRRTKAEAAETRTNIIAAAEKLFYDKGVPETTLEDIAREAGVTRGAIYWHFANKAEVLVALQQCVPLPQEDMFLRELQSNPPDPMALIEKTSLEWLDLIARDERRQRIFSILLRCENTPEMAEILDRQRQADSLHCDTLVRAFHHARANGQLSPDWTPDAAAKTFFWMVKGLYGDWLRFGMQFDLKAEGGQSLSRLFACFRNTDGASR